MLRCVKKCPFYSMAFGLVVLYLCLFIFTMTGIANETETTSGQHIEWELLNPGLEFGKSSSQLSGQSSAPFFILRIDPELYKFTLNMASEEAPARPIHKWAKDYDLFGAINASMYLPDILTSTGYMRAGEHVNNPKTGTRLGAFFVANPKEKGLPKAAILEGQDQTTLETLEKYEIVIQNFRLLSKEGENLWAKDATKHSIAAVGQDSTGKIVFILYPQPVSPGEFAEAIGELDLRGVMYVEGGSKARMLVRRMATEEGSEPSLHVYRGVSSSIIDPPGEPLLPNVLGVVPR